MRVRVPLSAPLYKVTMKILILEDDPERQQAFRENNVGVDVVIVDTTAEAIRLLQEQCWDIAFLDHDLGGQIMVASGPGTGYEVATWLEEHPKSMPDIVIVHSFNPGGREKMCAALPKALAIPGVWGVPDGAQAVWTAYTQLIARKDFQAGG